MILTVRNRAPSVRDIQGEDARVAHGDQGEVQGLPHSLTTLSPVRPERLGELRRRLAFVAYAPGVGRPLLELGTVQYARWALFSHLPSADGSGAPRRLGWTYLLFDATYDGSKEQYVRAFADILPLRLTKLFGTCFGFESMVEDAPGSERRVVPAAAFERFLKANTLKFDETRHFWCAQRDSVGDKRQAIEIERATRRADRRRDNPIGTTQYKVHAMALGPPATRPTLTEATVEPWRRRLRPAEAVNPLVLALPLKKDAWHDAEALTLGPLPHTHFARVVCIPATMQQDLGHVYPDRLDRDYLLVSCDYDGTLDRYVTALLKEGMTIHEFFECCEGYPGVDKPYELRHWILDHRLKVQYYLAGLPPRTVRQFGDLLKDRRLIARVMTGGAEDA